MKNKWKDITDDELLAIDLLSFNNYTNPYGDHDNSINNAFLKGKTFLDETVRNRIQFTQGRVLDLLCGFGRWLPSLASANEHVLGLERLQGCVNLAQGLCDYLNINNVELVTGDINYIEGLRSSTFDYVWMWSALQYVDRDWTLQQVFRLLKPGGRLFVGAYNSTGIMLQHVMAGIENGTVHEGASSWALSALSRGPSSGGCPNYCELELLTKVCNESGFNLVCSSPEPGLDLRQPDLINHEMIAKVVKPFPHYYRTIEFIAEKSRSRSRITNYDFREIDNKPNILAKLIKKLRVFGSRIKHRF